MTAYWNKDKYADLPLILPKMPPITDSDIAFAGDMSYMRELLLEIQLQAMVTGVAQPFPLVLTDELDHAITEMAGIKARIREMNHD